MKDLTEEDKKRIIELSQNYKRTSKDRNAVYEGTLDDFEFLMDSGGLISDEFIQNNDIDLNGQKAHIQSIYGMLRTSYDFKKGVLTDKLALHIWMNDKCRTYIYDDKPNNHNRILELLDRFAQKDYSSLGLTKYVSVEKPGSKTFETISLLGYVQVERNFISKTILFVNLDDAVALNDGMRFYKIEPQQASYLDGKEEYVTSLGNNHHQLLLWPLTENEYKEFYEYKRSTLSPEDFTLWELSLFTEQ